MADEKDVELNETVDKDLINFLSDFEPANDDVVPEPEPKPEPDPVDPKPTDSPKDESKPTPVEPKPDPTPPEPVDELAEVKKQNELLLKRISLLENPVIKPTTVVPKPTDPKPPTPEVDPNFLEGIEDQEYDELFSDPKKFNALLLKVYNKGKEYKTSDVSENVLRNIPKLVVEYQKRHQAMADIATQFYKDNPDLVKVSKTVAAITNEVAAEMPDKTVDECFKEVAKRTREVLGIKAKASNEPVPVAGNPKLPDKVSQKRTNTKAGELKGLAKEIDDIMNI
jgi:hypothetical protein